MSGNHKWGVSSFYNKDSSPVNVVLFISRNKDNKEVEGFKERRLSFITTESIDSPKLVYEFEKFVNAGVKSEVSRMYYSVNERDNDKIYKLFLHFLIDNPEFNLCAVMPKLAGLAATKECAATKRWLFDFDLDNNEAVTEFKNDILLIDSNVDVKIHKTPHGYAVVTNRGFDTRKLLNKWQDVTLKRDDMLCYKWVRKER